MGCSLPFWLERIPMALKDRLFRTFSNVPKAFQIAKGQAAMLCPICGEPWRFPNGWFSNPVSGVGLPLFYWSKRIWDTYTDERKAEVQQRVPNVEQYLR